MNTEILGRIATFSNDIAGIFLCFIFYTGWMKRKSINNLKSIISLLLIGLILIIANQIIQISMVFLIISILIYTSIAFIYYQGKLWIRLVSGFFFVSLGIVSELFASIFISVSYQLSLEQLLLNQGLYLAGSLISRLILLIMVQGFLMLTNKKAQWLSIKYWIVIALMPVFSMFITIGLFFQVNEIGIGTPLMLFSAIAVLYINLISFWLFSKINSEHEKILFMETANQQLQLQQYYYGELQENYKANRGLWHDMRNNLLTIRGGLEAGNCQEVKKHVDNLLAEVEHPAALHYSGNPIVDSLLFDKVRKAEKNKIKLKMEIRVQENLEVPTEDISTILGNAMDNALEGCLRHTDSNIEKVIDLQLIEEKNHLLVYIKNTADDGEINLHKEKYVSSKRKGTDTGFGIYNMEKAVLKNGGNIKIGFQNGWFEVKILLPLNRSLH